MEYQITMERYKITIKRYHWGRGCFNNLPSEHPFTSFPLLGAMEKVGHSRTGRGLEKKVTDCDKGERSVKIVNSLVSHNFTCNFNL